MPVGGGSAHSESETVHRALLARLDSKADLTIIRNCDMTERENLTVPVNSPRGGASKWMLILVQPPRRHFRFPALPAASS